MFNLYSGVAGTQLLGWLLVFVGLILLNEVGRQTKMGGITIFIIVPSILTLYYLLAYMGFFGGNENLTVKYMSGWFHYFKLYAATLGCIGFVMIKYKWSIGAKEWFKPWPFVIVAINILIAVVSDLESLFHVGMNGGWWVSNEGVFIYGGWWNLLNGVAGLLDIFCMTGWWGIYSSKDGAKDMLWPDMTRWFVIAYDIWNFEYTYLNLPTHSWYCGIALLLAPTFTNSYWNKGGWIQNRAFTLSIWCMFAQTFPTFQLSRTFGVLPSVYGNAGTVSALDLYTSAIELYNTGFITGPKVDATIKAYGIKARPTAQGVIAVMSIISNVLLLCAIIKKSLEENKDPYRNDIWVGTEDYNEAMARADTTQFDKIGDEITEPLINV